MITLGINPICFLIAFAIIAVAPQLMSGVARAKMRAASLEAATPRRTSEDGEDRPTRERRSFAAASSPLLKGNDDYEKWEAPKRESRRHRPSASTTWRSSRRRRRRRRFNDDAKPSAAPSVAECEPLKVAAAADSGGGGGGAGEWIYDAAATAAHRQRGPGVSARLRCASEEHRALGNTRVVCQRTLRWMPAPSGYCVPPPQGLIGYLLKWESKRTASCCSEIGVRKCRKIAISLSGKINLFTQKWSYNMRGVLSSRYLRMQTNRI